MMSHNPTIHHHDGRYYLFYTGTTYTRPRPQETPSEATEAVYDEAWDNKRIGVAIADSPRGPWQRFDAPILNSRPGHWDAVITSNAAPAIHADGSVTLVYKSTALRHTDARLMPGKGHILKALTIGVARAPKPEGPYERVGAHDGLIWIEGERRVTEDAYAWFDGELYHMLVKTFDDTMIDEPNAGVYVISRNGADWFFPENGPKAYSLTLDWADGTTTTLDRLERPQVLLQDGAPSHLFLAAKFATAKDSVGTPAPNKGIPFNVVVRVGNE